MRWIKLHSQITKWQWYKSASTSRVFLHLLLMAADEAHYGEACQSVRQIATELDIPYKAARIAMDNLLNTGEIEMASSTGRGGTRYKIASWEFYQLGAQKNASENSELGAQKNTPIFDLKNGEISNDRGAKKTPIQGGAQKNTQIGAQKNTPVFDLKNGEISNDRGAKKCANRGANRGAKVRARARIENLENSFSNEKEKQKKTCVRTYARGKAEPQEPPKDADEVLAYANGHCHFGWSREEANRFIYYNRSRGWKDTEDWRYYILLWNKRL